MKNPDFVKMVKSMVVEYVRGAIMSAEIPDIVGEKEWGRYNMRGLTVDDVDMTHDSLDIEVTSGVQLTLNQVHAQIGQFQWNFIKTKGFPKMADKGKATAKISDT